MNFDLLNIRGTAVAALAIVVAELGIFAAGALAGGLTVAQSPRWMTYASVNQCAKGDTLAVR